MVSIEKQKDVVRKGCPLTRVWARLVHLKPYVKAVYLAVSNFDIQMGGTHFLSKVTVLVFRGGRGWHYMIKVNYTSQALLLCLK